MDNKKRMSWMEKKISNFLRNRRKLKTRKKTAVISPLERERNENKYD